MTTVFREALHPRNPLTGEWIDVPGLEIRAPDADTRTEPLPNPAYGGREPDWWQVAGGCTYLATAIQLMHPDYKIATAYYHETIGGGEYIAHAVAYDPKTGRAFDGYGIHDSYDDALSAFGDKSHPLVRIDPDTDPVELAERMGYDYDPEEPFLNDQVFLASQFAEYWFEPQKRGQSQSLAIFTPRLHPRNPLTGEFTESLITWIEHGKEINDRSRADEALGEGGLAVQQLKANMKPLKADLHVYRSGPLPTKATGYGLPALVSFTTDKDTAKWWDFDNAGIQEYVLPKGTRVIDARKVLGEAETQGEIVTTNAGAMKAIPV